MASMEAGREAGVTETDDDNEHSMTVHPGPGLEEAPHYAGHRQRLRKRFLTMGADALADYELLELLLFLAHPRGDVKPLAKTLLKRFGSFADTITAEPAELMKVSGIGETSVVALKTAQAASVRLLGKPLLKRPVLSNWDRLLAYCRAAMAYSKVEQFRILFLDKKNLLIADEVHQEGTIDHTPVYPRELVRRALELAASAVIMVHNHPSGDPSPS
jgi:DNA repair protein RadC